MNHNMTKIGLEYFYYRIRNLLLDKDELVKIQENIKSSENKKEKLQEIQFQLGKVGFFKEDVLDLIEEEVEIEKELEIAAKVFSFTAVYILILFIFLRAQAILFIFLLLGINTFIYKKFNEITLGKLESLVRLKSILFVAEKLIKNKNEIFLFFYFYYLIYRNLFRKRKIYEKSF